VTTRWADPARSRALLVGVPAYTDAKLQSYPVIGQNVADLRAVLTDPGIGGLDPASVVACPPGASVAEIGNLLTRLASEATDLLLFYYCGHGLPGGVLDRQGYYLGVRDTIKGQESFSALPYAAVRRVFLGSKAARRVVIIDSCFSGRALGGTLSAGADIAQQVAIAGAYTMVSAPENDVALVLDGEPHTAFTGRLLNLLREGIPGPGETLTLGEISEIMKARLQAAGLPPLEDSDLGGLYRLPLVRNRAYTPPAPPDGDPHIAMQRALVDLDYQPEQIGAVMDYIAEQGLERVTSSMKPAAQALLSGQGKKASQAWLRSIEAAVAGPLIGQPEATQRVAAQAAAASAAGLMEAALIQVPIAGWRNNPDLTSAARRTLAAPGVAELVSLAPYRADVSKENRVTIQVQGRSVATLRVELSLAFEVSAVLAQVRDGRLVELREGSAVISTTLAIEGAEIAAREQNIGELSRLIPMSAGLRLLPTQDYPSDIGSVYWELGTARDEGKAHRRWRT
jgi:hypothetical protein